MAQTKRNTFGFACPVRGCKQKNNRRFTSPLSLAAHISEKHGDEELRKRLRATESRRTTGKGLWRLSQVDGANSIFKVLPGRRGKLPPPSPNS